MADWNTPITTTAYATVLTALRDRDFDAISLCLNDPTNMINGMVKLVRSGTAIRFQERETGAWVDRILSLVAGGTGATTASGARTNLGLGSMAVQDSNAVSISGGTLAGTGSGLTSLTAANITSGGTLPNLNGSNLTALNGTNVATGTVAAARLGSGSSITTKFLRGDSTWQDVSVYTDVRHYSCTITGATTSGTVNITASGLTTITGGAGIAGIIIPGGPMAEDHNTGTAPLATGASFRFTSTTQVTVERAQAGGLTSTYTYYFSVISVRIS